ncbi:MAG: FeoB-associated Cys-rich membrane protein [Gemmatimonadota bacterium]|jgi:hypothetical protein|nr:FeoB-associated Cys-rich membrane protein [Gemmatimonadota bacterium]MDQ8174620.1 FeoB-associated Cys-rich membrane protein [Gemmatimonadota bacterium]
MRMDTVITLAIVAVALGAVMRRLFKQMRAARTKRAGGPGCDDCGHG